MMAFRKKYFEIPTFLEGFHDENLAKNMEYSKFGDTSLYVSLLGFGGSALALCYENPEEEEAIDTVVKAVKSGINYIDTAPFYGHERAEKVLGKALKRIPRSTYYLATKTGRFGPDVKDLFDFSAQRTLKSFEDSRKRLGVDYFDVLVVHDLEYAPSVDIIFNETLPTLQQLKNEGKIKFIAISGYPLSKLKEVIEGSPVKIDIVLCYCRNTLFNNDLEDYLPFFKEKKVGIISAAALGMGLLTNNGPPDWHPATQEIKDICKQAVDYCKEKNVDIAKLAAKHSLSHPSIETHLIGMKSCKELENNLSVLHNGLSTEEEAVKNEIQTKYFSRLKQSHWEDFEVKSYWEQRNSGH